MLGRNSSHTRRAMAALILLLLTVALSGCGVFQVAVDQTAAPDRGLQATQEALSTENARLAGQVATLSAQLATPPAEANGTPSGAATATASPSSQPIQIPTVTPTAPGAATTAVATATLAPAPPPTRLPLPAARTRIRFAAGATSYTLRTTLVPGVTQGWVMGIQGGQRVVVSLTGDAVVELLDPADSPLPIVARDTGTWTFRVPTTDDYTLLAAGSGPATITIVIPPL
jgi:hypothetical protein